MTKKYTRKELIEIVDEILEMTYETEEFCTTAESIVGTLFNEGIFDPNQVEGA